MAHLQILQRAVVSSALWSFQVEARAPNVIDACAGRLSTARVDWPLEKLRARQRALRGGLSQMAPGLLVSNQARL